MAISAVSGALSAIIAFIVVIVNVNSIKQTNLMRQMESAPRFHVVSTTRMGEKAGVTIKLKNEGNIIISIDKMKLVVPGTYKTLDLDFKYAFDVNSSELGRIVIFQIPRDVSFFDKECQIVIYYKDRYSKLMKSLSPKFDIFSGNNTEEFMSIEREANLLFSLNHLLMSIYSSSSQLTD